MVIRIENKTSHFDLSKWPGSLEPVVRRARRPLATPVGETWTYATASPTVFGLEAALLRSTPTAYHGVLKPRPESLRTWEFNLPGAFRASRNRPIN